MLRTTLSIAFTSIASNAMAHAGHIESVSGHSHYLAAGAGVIAIALVSGWFVKVKRSKNV